MNTPIDRSGPRRYELLFAHPSSLEHFVTLRQQIAAVDVHSKLPWVLGDEWEFKRQPLSKDEKYIALRKRFIDGKSWEESGIYEHLMRGLKQRQRVAASRGAVGKFDGLSSKKDYVERYKKIDALFEQVKREGRLRTNWEVTPGPLAQRNAVRVKLDKNGEFIFCGLGFHRLAIAKALQLPSIPVALSIAHKDAIQNGHLARHREFRDKTLDQLELNLPKEAIYVAQSALAELGKP